MSPSRQPPSSLVTYLPPVSHNGVEQPKRADLLSLKSRLAALLPLESGHLYWAALVDFLGGRLNREELGEVLGRVLGKDSTGEGCKMIICLFDVFSFQLCPVLRVGG